MKYLCLVLLVGCVTSDPGAAPAESEWAAAVTACPSGQWCSETPPSRAAGNLLHAAWAASADDVFAVGDRGTILRRNNDVWSAMESGTTANLRGVYGTSASDVWVGGVGGVLLHFDGEAWTSVSGATTDIDAVWAASTTDAWFVGGGTVLHWVSGRFTSYGFAGPLLSVSGNGPNDVFVTGEGVNVRRWNGSTWTMMNAGVGTSSLLSVLAVATNDVWIGSPIPGKETSHWTGSKWVTARTSSAFMNSMSALSSTDIWGAGGNKVSHWNGSAWTTEQPFGSVTLWSMATRPGHAWVVGGTGTSGGLIAHRSL